MSEREFRQRTFRLLEAFVYDYLKKTGCNETAKTYFEEAKLNDWPPPWLEQLTAPISQIPPDPVIPNSAITANVSASLDNAIDDNSGILVSPSNINTATSSSHATSPINVNSSPKMTSLVFLQPSNLQILDQDLNIEKVDERKHDVVNLQTCGESTNQISVKLEELISTPSIIIPEIKSEPGTLDENLRDLSPQSPSSHERMPSPKTSRESSIEWGSEVSDDQLPDLTLPLEGQDGFLQDWWIILWENYKAVYEGETGMTLGH